MSEHTTSTVCSANCGGRSLLRCTVRDGRLVKVEPGAFPDPRYTAACVRCLTLPQWVYSEDRIPSPMRRTGRRGDGQAGDGFEPISWDEALDEVAGRLRRLVDQHGAASIAFTRTSGSSMLGNYSRLAALLGPTRNFYGGVDMAVHMGLNSTLGYKGMFGQHANEWPDRVHSDVIVVWGNNPAETSMTSMRFLLDARDAGSQLVVVDPRYSATAMHANWWVAPRPGTDLALMLGLLHVVIADGLVDREFAIRHTVAPLLVRADDGRYLRMRDVEPGGSNGYCVWDPVAGRAAAATDPPAPGHAGAVEVPIDGTFRAAGIEVTPAFELLRRLVAEHPPERVESETGVPAADVRDLAVAIATAGATMIGFGYGVDRYLHGDLVTRAGATLAALTGQIGRPGAGVGVQSHGGGFREVMLGPGPPLPRGATTESVPNIVVGQRPLDVRALFCQGDWLNQRVADMNVLKDFVAGLEFVVTVDHFWQTTAQWSDIVLPASTFLEATSPVRDVVTSRNSVLVRRKVIDPVGGSRPDADIERDLAQRLGLGEWFTDSPEDVVRSMIDESPDPALAGVTYDDVMAAGGALRIDGPEAPHVQYADLRFPTPTRRVQFYLEELVELGEALPVHRADHEASATHAAATRFPLVLIQSHVRQRAHSTFFNTPWTLQVWPEPTIELNPDDAARRGLSTGDVARAFNDRGRVVAKVVTNPDYPPGMCNVSEGWKQHQYLDGNVQELTAARINPVHELLWTHANLPFFDTRVEVEGVTS
ncbi:MAG: molybdopterin-dependent oxidoreductase [Ilumatobacteraceae bacterium]